MGLYFTSRVFEAARAMRDRLREQEWPTSPVTGVLPLVALTEIEPDVHGESVWVVPDFGDDSVIDWQRFPNGRGETFDVVVQIDCLLANDEDAMLDRLEELADVVQRAVYDDTGTAPLESGRMNPLDVGGQVALGGISAVQFSMWPAGDLLHGRVVVRYSHVGRI